MKILLLTQYYPPEVGAAQARLEALTKELMDAGHSVEVVTSQPNYPLGKTFPGYEGFSSEENLSLGGRHQVRVLRYWSYASQGSGLGRLLNYLSFTLTCLFSLTRTTRPDVVFVNSGPLFLGLPGFIFAKRYRRPMVFNVSDLWPRSVEHLSRSLGGIIFVNMALLLERWVYRKADLVNAITEGVKKHLLEEKNVPASKVLFLPNGVDLSLFTNEEVLLARGRELRAQLKLEDKLVLIYPGNHGFAHALDYVLQAAKLLQDSQQQNNQQGKSAHFVLIGGGSDKSRLQNLARDLELKNVSFLDPVPMIELVPYLKMADMGIIHLKNSPLAEETRPAKMFPLMAAKLPILFCGFGEGRTLLAAQQPDFILDPEKPELIADFIRNIPRVSDRLKTIGEANYRLVQEHYSTKSLVARWLGELGQHVKAGS